MVDAKRDYLRRIVRMQRLQFFLECWKASGRRFEKNQHFARCLYFALPPVDRINGGSDVSAGSKAAHDQFLCNSLRRTAIGKRAQREQNFIRHSLGRDKRGAPADPTAANYNVAIVDNRRLTRRDRFLRRMQLHLCAIII
jgi:hypothetical protein